jgi:hypothetical protein
MTLPWPITDSDAVLYEALDIAIGYLERTGWADEDDDAIQAMAASVILSSYGRGVRHRIRLANDAIVALQAVPLSADVRELRSFCPRLLPQSG